MIMSSFLNGLQKAINHEQQSKAKDVPANESAERIRYLELAAIRMRADLAYFVKRCDRGEIRSCATQARFRATLDAIPEIVQSPPRF